MRTLAVFLACVLSGLCDLVAGQGKTLRVEHGRPIVQVSQMTVLLLELLKESRQAAEVAHEEPNWDHCRAEYRLRLFDGTSGSATNGVGVVEEICRVASRSPAGQELQDMGSRTGISIGEFSVSWSQVTAGAPNWLSYQASSTVRFIPQPQRVVLDSVDDGMFRRYPVSRNVEEFMTAGQTVQIIGPVVFSGDLADAERRPLILLRKNKATKKPSLPVP